ncbi:WD40/YVTN/BNR-like repeat-containing protein [Leeuwenhoekiella blandensis]|uniref:Putative oxidoreductase n=1 Tax=Leeuwenhoekiella blandensis (strain CECT 7118 / CCUG 51940 / KCTC 22103 / MED217) TaxID=398720 RepID=A3XMB9_LEEBM|nr:oxidoreductase [Leeuwenhoekiella blandensis]EAQ49309.1 putative oxidoreductase [Leeuwenhoekiella blandensis MED217]
MRYLLGVLLSLLILSCKNTSETKKLNAIQSVEIETIYEDSVSIRALEILDDGSVAFAGSNGKYGLYNPSSKVWNTAVMRQDSLTPNFRAVAHTAEDFFMLSIESPALLYKTGNSGAMELVYEETDPKAFYDSMRFWNDQEGIAMGDPTENCISIIITRDGGKTWTKVSCDKLPEAAEGEAAFAASNSNIAVYENNAWIITGGMKSRVLHTGDKGKTWEVFDTPLKQGTPTTGGYSIDFYDANLGVIIGGDYKNPKGNEANKAITKDGGKTWELLADKENPGHRSNIQFVPGSEGQELLTVSYYSIDYSKDQGATWKNLSSEGFFTVRFLNDSTAYAAGNGSIARLTFKR